MRWGRDFPEHMERWRQESLKPVHLTAYSHPLTCQGGREKRGARVHTFPQASRAHRLPPASAARAARTPSHTPHTLRALAVMKAVQRGAHWVAPRGLGFLFCEMAMIIILVLRCTALRVKW